jgi:uncharacterized protein YyaL (SSP411 family)
MGATNRLAGETSPYLLQHAHNPVDWYPWGDAAFRKARDEQKPIFLSIGYAACHWCHVMERESFENATIADYLNRNFVCVKVDREERPDVDEIYMSAVQIMTGQGGWPLSVFLTPELEPFMGGTYFPPDNRYGRIGFPDLLRRLHEAWETRRDDIDRSAKNLTADLKRIAHGLQESPAKAAPGAAELSRGVAELSARFDARWGGFGAAPKFPPDGALRLLLLDHARSGAGTPLRIACATLDAMARGGLYDHVGGGFTRYSVDERWLVPHFEKMLYNQALLAPLYVDAWRLTGNEAYRSAATETLDFVRRELTDPGGGFYSSLDADSEGGEGAFYVWTPDTLAEALGEEDAALFAKRYDVDHAGNFEGRSIPNLIAGKPPTDEEPRLRALRQRLLAARERRPRPATDDKVLTAWNGLMISAFAQAHAAFGRRVDIDAAERAADFALAELRVAGRLRVSYRAGSARLNGYLDDYAFLARGLLDLYETGFTESYLLEARSLAQTLIERFEDRVHGGFFFTSDDHETLLTRSRSLQDGALPSGAGVACETLIRLATHLDDEALRETAERALRTYAPAIGRMPSGFASLVAAADLAASPRQELVIAGDPESAAARALLAEVRGRYLPGLAIAWALPDAGTSLPLPRDKRPVDGGPAAYLCRNHTCEAPITAPAELGRRLDTLGRRAG